MERYNQQHIEDYLARHGTEVMANLAKCAEAPDWMKRLVPFQKCWRAGCWLNYTLQELGASEEEIHRIGFAHGQRSTFGDANQWALAYANEYALTHAVQDQPGEALADTINKEVFPI